MTECFPQHPFGAGVGSLAPPGKSLKWLLGGKGANLAEMAGIGLNIPPGFTLTTEVCKAYCDSGVQDLPAGVWEEAMKVPPPRPLLDLTS